MRVGLGADVIARDVLLDVAIVVLDCEELHARVALNHLAAVPLAAPQEVRLQQIAHTHACATEF
jgi:hypothetical protein